jgi:hypothetical protein
MPGLHRPGRVRRRDAASDGTDTEGPNPHRGMADDQAMRTSRPMLRAALPDRHQRPAARRRQAHSHPPSHREEIDRRQAEPGELVTNCFTCIQERPATPDARARYTSGPRARAHAREDQARRSIAKQAEQAVTIASQVRRQADFRRSTPRCDAPRHRTSHNSRVSAATRFPRRSDRQAQWDGNDISMHLRPHQACDISSDINRGTQPRPSTHNVTTATRRGVVRLRASGPQ